MAFPKWERRDGLEKRSCASCSCSSISIFRWDRGLGVEVELELELELESESVGRKNNARMAAVLWEKRTLPSASIIDARMVV